VDRDVHHAEALTEADITREIPGFSRSTNGPKPKTTSTIYAPAATDEPEFRLPEAGQSFLGFWLERELGRGAVGRVFLARQPDMADRPVVLKVTKGRAAEAQSLARLRHTNIVPIYSAHEGPGFFALCMPYDGGVTFATVLEKVRSQAEIPTSGHFFAELCQADAPGAAVAAATFDRLSFADAVLMLGGRLAKGLAHAHDRGLIHCDVKPANVLLTDDGQAMLLDFDVALDVRATEGQLTVIGGTLQYMSPDQFELLLGRRTRIDGRSDVYSLGLVLYELLTGRLPFEPPDQPTAVEVERALAGRNAVPKIRAANPAVSPGAEAIIRQCLAPDPDTRYPSAAALAEDIERHLSDQPLKYARETSPGEQFRKWARRNPRLASPAGIVAVLAVFALAAVTYGVQGRFQALAYSAERERVAAADLYRKALPALRLAQAELIDAADPTAVAQSRAAARATLEEYDLRRTDWATGRPAALPAEDLDTLAEERGAILFLLARSGRGGTDADRAAAREALGDRAPAALALQAGESGVAPASALDRLLFAAELAAAGHEREALRLLEEYTTERPVEFVGWLLRGNCLTADGQDAAAIGCYSACAAIRPEFAPVYFRRGLAEFRLREFRAARTDFDIALRFDPGHSEARIWRALTCQMLGRPEDGLPDLDAVLAQPNPPVKAYYFRARLRRLTGQRELAQADEQAAVQHEPADEASWIERGVSRLNLNPEAALEDFRAAERLNPRSVPALQNQVYVLMEKLGRPREAMGVLNRVLAVRPDYAPSLIARALLNARDGQVEPAVEDVEQALKADPRPTFRYQAAGVYAVLTKVDRAHGLKAIDLLAVALKGGYPLIEIRNNVELDVIRDWPEFQAVVEAARVLSPEKP
jgi:eukaryotic-like serine/threonine-protein kinase